EPSLRWTREYTRRQIVAHATATEGISGAPTLIVWPENAVPRYLDAEPMLVQELAELARRRRADLLFGGPRWDGGRAYNSIRLITADGRNGGSYDKQQLVLFAEDKPFDRKTATREQDGPDAFTAGRVPGVLQGFVKLGVSICHEVLFPELVGATVRNGAELLV